MKKSSKIFVVNQIKDSPSLLTRSIFESTQQVILDAEFFNRGALLLIDKPAGWTSFDVVNKIRRVTKCGKVGHCGTLDPFATGLLLIVTGSATKRADEFSCEDKVYRADFVLGKSTDTLDRDGKLMEERIVEPFELSRIHEVCSQFIGEIEQVPPAFSAIKVNGKPAYKYARRGQEVGLASRRVTIKSFRLLSYQHPVLAVHVECSKGTYIRALARDLGSRLGCGAYVEQLRRIQSGSFHVNESMQLEDFVNAVSTPKC